MKALFGIKEIEWLLLGCESIHKGPSLRVTADLRDCSNLLRVRQAGSANPSSGAERWRKTHKVSRRRAIIVTCNCHSIGGGTVSQIISLNNMFFSAKFIAFTQSLTSGLLTQFRFNNGMGVHVHGILCRSVLPNRYICTQQ